MSSWDNLDTHEWRAFLREDAKSVSVNTSPQSVGRGLQENCFYRIDAVNPYTGEKDWIQKASGTVEICNCEECSVLGDDVYEWLAIQKALEWLKENLPCASIELVVSADIYPYADAWIFRPFWGKGCNFLDELSRGVGNFGEKIERLSISDEEWEDSDVIVNSFAEASIKI